MMKPMVCTGSMVVKDVGFTAIFDCATPTEAIHIMRTTRKCAAIISSVGRGSITIFRSATGIICGMRAYRSKVLSIGEFSAPGAYLTRWLVKEMKQLKGEPFSDINAAV